jgi:hypothetical protein
MKVVNMTVNTCKIYTRIDNQTIASNAVACTNNVELLVHMLTCPRQTQ